jgi:hypothetical protein
MAPFRHGRDDISPSPLDWSRLQNGPVVLYLRSSYLAEDALELENLGYELRVFDCSAWSSSETMHSSTPH